MSDQVADDREARTRHDPFNRVTDVADMTERASGLDGPLECFPRYGEKPLDLRRDPPDGEGPRRVRAPPVQLDPHVDGNDIAFIEDTVGGRYAVHDLLVDRGADRGGKPVGPLKTGTAPLCERMNSSAKASSDAVEIPGMILGSSSSKRSAMIAPPREILTISAGVFSSTTPKPYADALRCEARLASSPACTSSGDPSPST